MGAKPLNTAMSPLDSLHVRRLLAVVRSLKIVGSLLWLALVFAALPSLAWAKDGDSIAKSFNVPAGTADKTLKQFSEQAGVQVLFPTDRVRGVRTNAVKGELVPVEALEQMVAQTELVVIRDEKTGALGIKREASVTAAEKNGESRRVNDSTAGVGKVASALPEQTLVLSPFIVSANADEDRYQPTEATSGGRVRTNIFDSSQNVSVIGGEVIRDVGATRIMDAMKYVAGVSESSIPNGLDRITIRGFLTTLRTVDGVTSTSQANIDPFLIERIEIVKGPNAILAPAGVPGGTINNVSKKPVYRDFSNAALEVGRFDSSRVEFDVNRVIGTDKKLAVRVLAAAQHGQDIWGLPKDFFMTAPMFTYRFSPTTSLTWQTHLVYWKIGNYDGIAIDPSAGTTNEAKIYQGVPRFLNIYGPDSYRQDDRIEHTLTFLASPTDSLAFRLLARYDNQFNENNNGTTLAGNSTSAGTNNNSYDPLTGNYTPDLVYAQTAPYTASPAPAISRTYNRAGSLTDQSSLRLTLQADLVHSYKAAHWEAETLLGFAYGRDTGHDYRTATTAAPVTLENFVYSADVYGANSRDQLFTTLTSQLFVNEKLTLFDNRLILNAGYSKNYWDFEVIDRRGAGSVTKAKPEDDLVNYGAVIKPVRNVALYYSHAQNASPLPVANIAAGGPSTQTGVQDEYGVRVHLRDNRIRLNASYYHIQQDNTNVPNPANFAFPPPVPALPGLLADRTAKGWEFEAQGSVTKNLSIIAAYTDYTNRNPFGQEFRGASEKAWSALLHYEFGQHSNMEGFSASMGIDYLNAKPGVDASGQTVAGVNRKPSFYLPARTLVNAALSYRHGKTWHAQLNLDNVFNTEYLSASLSRGSVWVGTPFNARLKLTYQF